MEKKIKIGVSNRHVHLTKEVYELLFDEEMSVYKNLLQMGEFASNQKVTLKSGDYEINNVRVLGPFRKYNQVEISHNDALKFKINPPVKASGDLENASPITLVTKKASITLPCAIIAQRHIHMSKEDAKQLGLQDKQLVSVKISGDKSGIMDAYVKVSDNASLEMHIDTDDANCFLINSGDEGTLLL